MKNPSILPLILSACVLAHAPLRAQQDVSSILSDIAQEKKEPEQKNSDKVKLKPRPSAQPTPRPKPSKTSQSASPRPNPPSLSLPVYRPKDKLPKNVNGSGVAGDFLVFGEDLSGGLVLIAAEDHMNPLSRKFIVKNKTTGYAPGTMLPSDSRRLISISPQRPLIFIGRGILPGEYLVKVQ